MIQRIQTIYLLLITGVLIAALFLPLGTAVELDGSAHLFKPLGLTLGNEYQSTWGLFCILLLATIVDFRSEERRVGKEGLRRCKSRWARCHCKY